MFKALTKHVEHPIFTFILKVQDIQRNMHRLRTLFVVHIYCDQTQLVVNRHKR